MSLKFKAVFVLGLMVLASLNLAAQKPADLVGTWTGSAVAEGDPEPNDLTLVLELTDGKLSGHMSDSYGILVEAPVTEVMLEEGMLKFSVSATGPDGGAVTVSFEMKVDGEAMEGKFELPDMGMTGKWKAEKTK